MRKKGKTAMKKVAIKRIKRPKKPISTEAKVLAGLGVASSLSGLGGMAKPSVAPAPVQQTNIVAKNTRKSQGIAEKVKSFFGIKEAKAEGWDGDWQSSLLGDVNGTAPGSQIPNTWTQWQGVGSGYGPVDGAQTATLVFNQGEDDPQNQLLNRSLIANPAGKYSQPAFPEGTTDDEKKKVMEYLKNQAANGLTIEQNSDGSFRVSGGLANVDKTFSYADLLGLAQGWTASQTAPANPLDSLPATSNPISLTDSNLLPNLPDQNQQNQDANPLDSLPLTQNQPNPLDILPVTSHNPENPYAQIPATDINNVFKETGTAEDGTTVYLNTQTNQYADENGNPYFYDQAEDKWSPGTGVSDGVASTQANTNAEANTNNGLETSGNTGQDGTAQTDGANQTGDAVGQTADGTNIYYDANLQGYRDSTGNLYVQDDADSNLFVPLVSQSITVNEDDANQPSLMDSSGLNNINTQSSDVNLNAVNPSIPDYLNTTNPAEEPNFVADDFNQNQEWGSGEAGETAVLASSQAIGEASDQGSGEGGEEDAESTGNFGNVSGSGQEGSAQDIAGIEQGDQANNSNDDQRTGDLEIPDSMRQIIANAQAALANENVVAPVDSSLTLAPITINGAEYTTQDGVNYYNQNGTRYEVVAIAGQNGQSDRYDLYDPIARVLVANQGAARPLIADNVLAQLDEISQQTANQNRNSVPNSPVDTSKYPNFGTSSLSSRIGAAIEPASDNLYKVTFKDGVYYMTAQEIRDYADALKNTSNSSRTDTSPAPRAQGIIKNANRIGGALSNPAGTIIGAIKKGGTAETKMATDKKTELYNVGTDKAPVWMDFDGNIYNNKGKKTGETYIDIWNTINLDQVHNTPTGMQQAISTGGKLAATTLVPGGMFAGKLVDWGVSKATNQNARDWEARWQTIVHSALDSNISNSTVVKWTDPSTKRKVTGTMGDFRMTLDFLRLNGILDGDYNFTNKP